MKFFASSNGSQAVKINDKNKDILFCKRAFSDVLKGLTSTKFSGGNPQAPLSNMVPLEKVKIHSDLLAEHFLHVKALSF